VDNSEISALVNYVQAVHFSSFQDSVEKNKNYHMSSFTEGKANLFINNNKLEFIFYNTRQLSRVYPKGSRILSSYFKPLNFWKCGVQMVALNFQTEGIAMEINNSIFEQNLRTGYLLKPDLLSLHKQNNAQCLFIHLISGQTLSKNKIRTYVEIEMFGTQDRIKFKSHRALNNAINPSYNSIFKFSKITCPEYAFVHIAVYEEKAKLIGKRILPFNAISSGYTFIKLRNWLGQPLSLPSLFLYIEKKPHIDFSCVCQRENLSY
jgi:hypothetical protein